MTAKIDKNRIRNSYREQAALTQLHRWIAYALEEKAPVSRLEGLFDANSLLSADGAAIATGMDDIVRYHQENSLATIISREVEVIGDLDGPFELQAVGRMQADGRKFQKITLAFDWQDRLRPLLSKISYLDLDGAKPKIEPVEPFASRLMSVSNRWHTLVEDPKRTPEPFREIISDKFVMEYGHGSVRSYEELADWVNGSASSVGASRHDLVGMTCEKLESDLYRAVFVLDWDGLTHSDKHMIAQSRHTWTIRDAPALCFPEIEYINVEFLQPFQVVE